VAGTLRVIALNHAVPNQIAAVVFVVAGRLTELVLALTFVAALGLLLLASVAHPGPTIASIAADTLVIVSIRTVVRVNTKLEPDSRSLGDHVEASPYWLST
jgi:hypothetical protein